MSSTRLDRSANRSYSRPTIPAVGRRGERRGRAQPHRSAVSTNVIFEPLRFRNLTVKNRVFRSSTGGRWDNYDGSGTETRINWDLKTARGGVGAIISSHAPVHPRGRLLPGYALIDRDDRVPFWRELVRRVHEYDCKYIVQLAHAGRERIIGGFEYPKGVSSTDKPEPLNGFECERLTTAEIGQLVRAFAAAARRAREAGADGVELAGANGVLFTQFLSSGINDREDEYGGSLENRARFALEVVRAVRSEVGADYFLGFKISIREHLNEILPWLRRGNSLEESLQICRWLEEVGVDCLHVSAGGEFPHPRNPAGDFPTRDMVKTYDSLISNGLYTFRNYLLFRTWPLNAVWKWHWERPSRKGVEGINVEDSRAVKQAVGIPVLCTGGFQTASLIADAIESGACDGVTIARALIANPDLVRWFEKGHDSASRPCTYCNKCLFAFIENPLGCYDESRFDSREEMVEQILSVYQEAA
jgi:2,4-dienoyl-CoA reductase-like NADH-dependent reductase (Old Yellow Enzyme family)